MTRFRFQVWSVAVMLLATPIVRAQEARIVAVGIAADRTSDRITSADEKTPAAKLCPTCKHFYPQTDRFCRVDGAPLADAEAPRLKSRACPRCKQSFESSAKFCPHDGAPLGDALPPIDPQSRNRPAKSGLAKDAAKSPRGEPANSSSGLPPKASARNDVAPVDSETSSTSIAADYVFALRAALAAPESEKAKWEERAERLGEQFRQQRRIAVAIQVQASDPSNRTAARQIESALSWRIHAAGIRDVELVSPESLATTGSWKRLLLRISVESDGEPNSNPRVESSVTEVELVQLGEPESELPKESDRLVREEKLSAALRATRPFGVPFVAAGDLSDATDQIGLEVIRAIHRLLGSHFGEGRRFEREGNKAQAIEKYLRFLFGTPDFDTPQAEAANEFIIAALKFSLLDWLWGEPDVAVVDSDRVARRLPLGFRPAPGEARSDELPRTIVCLRDGSEMVLVPGGSESMGNDKGSPQERPAHSVTLGSFYIDKLETSVGQYERFLAATGDRVPRSDEPGGGTQWNGCAAKKDTAQLPVVNVSWNDARTYAQWSGKSLPSEAQWERAARGSFAADYPRSADPGLARQVNAGRSGNGFDQLVSVFSHPAALNPYGCQNMLGNVAEWCRDWYGPAYYGQCSSDEPFGPDTGERRVVRGGSWLTPLDQLGPTRRDGSPPTSRSASVGFRCVLLVPNAP